MCYSNLSVAAAAEEVDDYFSMSPAELAATPVTIATERQSRFSNLLQ